nr:hypothetical protein [Tanacetum cinerariifolium]
VRNRESPTNYALMAFSSSSFSSDNEKMAQTPPRIHAPRGHAKHYARMLLSNPQRHVVPIAVVPKSKLVPINAARLITAVVPKIKVTRPRQAKPVVTKPNSPPRRLINRNPSPKASTFSHKVTAVKAPMVNAAKGVQGKWEWKLNGNPQHALKDKRVIDSGCSRHMTGAKWWICCLWWKSKELQDFWKRVIVTKPHNKTLYELLHGRTPSIGFMRPFGCHVTIFNTLDSLDKFDGKVDEGCLVGYSVSSKSFRVFNSRTQIVQETLHVNFLENKPNVTGSGPTWLFNIDTLTKTMNYQPITAGNQSNPSVEPECDEKKTESEVNVSPSSSAQSKKHDDKTKREAKGKSPAEFLTGYRNLSAEFKHFSDNSINEDSPTHGKLSSNSTNTFSAAGPSNDVASPTHGKSSCIDISQLLDDPNMPELEDITYSDDEDDVGADANFNNLETPIIVSPISTTRVHKDHPMTQIIGDTRSMTRVAKDQGRLSQINNEDFHICMFACFLLQEEPKRVHQALKDPSWMEAMQEELL